MYNPTEPYNKLPLLPPKLQLTLGIYKKIISANRVLAELKGTAETIPNQTIILNSLLLREAKDSSEIENIVTTQDELYKAFAINSINIDPATKEVLNYKEALWLGLNQIKKKQLITVREIINIQERLVENNAGIRKQPGTTLKSTKTQQIIYTPPFGKDIIEEKLKNLEQYINNYEDELDPLVKMAIIHYQFESIHPFYDGNGRTGRILNVLYLIYKELLDLPILYMSSYIIKNKKLYYDGLNNVREKNDWESWILFMLETVEYTANDTLKTIKQIRNLLEETIELVKKRLLKIYSKELVEVLFYQPYCKISVLENTLKISRFTASKYLKGLEDIGVMQGKKIGRDMLYINVALFNLLKK